MAISDETRAQRQKLKGKGAKAHLQYFWDYYKIPALVVICVIGGIIYAVHGVVTNRPDVFSLMVLNGQSSVTAYYDTLHEELLQALDVDPEENDISLDLQEYLTPGTSTSTYDMATNEKIVAQAAANLLDVMMADQYNFDHLARSGMYGDLRDYLTQEQLSACGDAVYYIDLDAVKEWQEASESSTYEEHVPDSETAQAVEAYDQLVMPDPSSMGDPVPVGLVVNRIPANARFGFYGDTTGILGVVNGTEHPEACSKFISYLFQHSSE